MLHLLGLLTALAGGGVLCLLAWHDLRWRRLPNRLVLLYAMLYPFFALSTPMVLLSHLALGAGFLLLGVFLMLRGSMGGGDAKLIGALMLWAGPAQWLQTLLVTTQSGLLLGLLGVIARLWLRRQPPESIRPALRCLTVGRGVPYGVALALGGVYAILVQYA
jgi:prepilin peptidase CpaA